jgi:CheY-like chemotaxis protein
MVLVVDDDPDLRDAIREALESEGHAVLTAGDGKEALDVLRSSGRVSLILVDLRMPTMDGRQLIRALQRDGNDTPVVVLSALAEAPRSGKPGPRRITGAVEFLAKPFAVDTLLRIVAEHGRPAR